MPGVHALIRPAAAIPGGLVRWGTVALGVLGIVVAAWAAQLIAAWLLRLLMRRRLGRVSGTRRGRTLLMVVRGGLRYATYFLAGLSILSLLGVPPSSLLAVAGVTGLALGFGAQSLVRDVISGLFIILEDQFAVGDYVTMAGVEGTVQEIGPRVCVVRGRAGELNFVPNGRIAQVTNHSRGERESELTLVVPYEEDLARVAGIVDAVAAGAAGQVDGLAGAPRLLGVEAFGPDGLELAVSFRSAPGAARPVARELMSRLKSGLDREGMRVKARAGVRSGG